MQFVNIFILTFLAGCVSLTGSEVPRERIYLSEKEIDPSNSRLIYIHPNETLIHIHQGHNVWTKTGEMHLDESNNPYVLENDMVRADDSSYEIDWRCPYCLMYWPMGLECLNMKCASKFTVQSRIE